jgi:hypothetical protein
MDKRSTSPVAAGGSFQVMVEEESSRQELGSNQTERKRMAWKARKNL